MAFVSAVSFPARIGRSLALALGGAMAVLIVVGAASLVFARQIFLNNESVDREYGILLHLDATHSAFDDLIFELHQADAGRAEARQNLLPLADEAERTLADLERHDADHVRPDERERHREDRRALERLAADGHALALRMARPFERLDQDDLQWLHGASHEVPRRISGLSRSHESRVREVLASNGPLIRAIALLFAGVVLVGIAVVGGAGIAAHRSITLPLARLSRFAERIAQGRLETRVEVSSNNELGLLSHTFNSMAARLEHQVSDLRVVQEALQDRVREAQALYRIGTEFARLQQMERILQSVVEKARVLLEADAAAISLFARDGGRVESRATSGPPEAFQPPAGRNGEGPIRPEFARTLLTVPLRIGSDDSGALHVAFRDERALSPQASEILTALATQAAIAIERARLSEDVRNVAALEERERLARELHDGMAQALSFLHLKTQVATDALARADRETAEASLREMLRVTDRAYDEVRQAMFGLRVFVARGQDLVATLSQYLRDFSEKTGIAVEFEARGDALGRVHPASEIQVVRIIQEALANVWKHAGTDRARVRLERHGEALRVSVRDDGRGWDAAASADRLHFGLAAMRERAEGLGGTLQVETAPGRGTTVTATIPGAAA